MKIKLSKSQWEFMGKKAGWMKLSQEDGQLQPTDGVQTNPDSKANFKKDKIQKSDEVNETKVKDANPTNQWELAKKIDTTTATIKAILLDPKKDQYQKRKEVMVIMDQNRDIFPVGA